jgi:hypothetical protein
MKYIIAALLTALLVLIYRRLARPSPCSSCSAALDVTGSYAVDMGLCSSCMGKLCRQHEVGDGTT